VHSRIMEERVRRDSCPCVAVVEEAGRGGDAE
jgi:hypothetical protein